MPPYEKIQTKYRVSEENALKYSKIVIYDKRTLSGTFFSCRKLQYEREPEVQPGRGRAEAKRRRGETEGFGEDCSQMKKKCHKGSTRSAMCYFSGRTSPKVVL